MRTQEETPTTATDADGGTTATAYVADPDAGLVDVAVPLVDDFGSDFSSGAYDDATD